MAEAITVVEYDPTWPSAFERFRERLWAVVGDFAESIEHVGSTAVPGLAAKPVIDIDVVVQSQTDVQLGIRRLAAIGYEHQGDLGIPGREAFGWPSGEPRHHVYVCVAGCDALQRHLLFRDYLRTRPDEAFAYAEAKKVAATAHGAEREAYSEAKREVGERIMEAARQAQRSR
jgi:GrpB-like predicted nucleotidyltransferase (UPF0157 family)